MHDHAMGAEWRQRHHSRASYIRITVIPERIVESVASSGARNAIRDDTCTLRSV